MSSSYETPPALRQAAQAIATARGRARQLRGVFDKSLIPMAIVDNDRRNVDVNAAARLLARIPLEELRQRRIDDFTADEDRPMLERAWAELMEHGDATGLFHLTFEDGSAIWIQYAGITNVLPGRHLVVFAPADWPGDELQGTEPEREEPQSGPLSERQLEVLRLVAVGANASQIAAELSISEATVRTHVKHILDRLGAHNRAHAVALAMTQGLLGEPAQI